VADIGGTLAWFEARDVFEEGLRIPPLKIYEAGEPNHVLMEIISANVRVPDQVLGDVGAIRAAEIVGARRLHEFFVDTGIDDLQWLADAILDRTEGAMRRAIAALPDGQCFGETWADGVGTPLHLKVAIDIHGDEISLDYSGSSPQYAVGSINNVYNLTFADTANSLKCSLLPQVPNNEGLFRPIHVTAPEGCVLNATFPVSVKSRSKTSFHIHNAIYAALAPIAPDKVQAGSGSFWAFTANGAWSDGTRYNVHILPNGGKGAVNDWDGLPTIAFPYNGNITPAEIIESQSPLLVVERCLATDSGGAGMHRGGLGQRITFRARHGTPITVSLRPDKVLYPTPGVLGGKPAPLGVCLVNGEPLAPDASVVVLTEGDEVVYNVPGGGGFGPPEERAPELVERDVELGFVSLDAAQDEYLVALDPVTGAVRSTETRRLRGSQSK
jgi:N-methylhydantoinase B/oxoprolinase/acetone carboxylase alpha subunit